MSQAAMNAVCIGCRLRRKRCDRKRPICTSCLELNISDDLCIYPDTKLQLASKDSKITLDMLRNKNKDLKKEYELLQNLSPNQIKLLSSNLNDNHLTHKIPPYQQEILQHLHPNHAQPIQDDNKPHQLQENSQYPKQSSPNNELLTTIKFEKNIHLHIGSLSWETLFRSEKDTYKLCMQFDELLDLIKTRHDKMSKNFTLEMDTDSRFQQLKQLLLSMLIGKIPLNSVYSTMDELLEIIANRLPPYDMVMTLVDRFFIMIRIQQNVMLEVNEDAIYETIGQCFSKGPNGRVQINVKFPEEWVKIPGISLVLGIVAQMLFQVNQLLNPITSANHLLILDSIQLLLVAFSIFRRFDIRYRDIMIPEVAIQFLQAFIFFSGFDTYNPLGREHERSDKTGENLILVWRMITYARAAYLNKDIDVVYKQKTKEYRRSLKSIWYWLAFLDVSESIEFGTKTKIQREELFYYSDHSNEYTRSITLLNELIYDYQQLENLDDPLEFINKTEFILIPKANQALNQFPNSVNDDLTTLHHMDFDNLSLVHKFMSTVQTFSIRLTTYALIHTYYYQCYKRLELTNSENEFLRKRYYLLSMKYGLLVFELIPAIFSAYKRLWGHEHSSTFGSLGTIISIFNTMKSAFRRVTIFVGGRIFENLPIQDRSIAILKLFQMDNVDDKTLLNDLIRHENQVNNSQLQFFQIYDLEDPQIDLQNDLLFKKFEILLDYKFVMLTCSRTMCDLVDYLKNSVYNLNFVSLNRAFFIAIKILSFFLRIHHSQTFKGIFHETFGIKESELNLKVLYERAIHSKGNFDIEDFF
ncbi:putative transcriptional regulatory protein [Wickerhamomyces ciferrii]|uniref:Transcriptional regulatory protein n=1 Tax=Wickerhamomyces ciferrii (strain ATCC 14091 / BCRC 22168 / CBS 111 / JCM 3599 / NBRC 0793 / NRRL Y-1031 F-60-10) TaxID=1206466 RepID=K0K8M6_WICCF|nr:putative transcriptional regulatory protein [Wickerhamomyces ciferrii]CCH41190.1 putative transcriptional regulatory protein [Wickerhamomyces ciferrii]